MTSLSEHRSSEMQHVPPSSPDRAEQGARDSPAGMLLAHIVVQSQDTFFWGEDYLINFNISFSQKKKREFSKIALFEGQNCKYTPSSQKLTTMPQTSKNTPTWKITTTFITIIILTNQWYKTKRKKVNYTLFEISKMRWNSSNCNFFSFGCIKVLKKVIWSGDKVSFQKKKI